MVTTAEDMRERSNRVATASQQADSNVQTVAAAAEELSSSISEISRQVSNASNIVDDAVGSAGAANEKVGTLASNAQKIGEVVSLITDIAEQTNRTPRKTLTFGGVTPELASGGLPCRPFGPVFRFLMSVSGVSERVFLYPGALRALSQTRRFIL